MKIKDIKTELGNQIIDDLLKDGWKKVKEYSLLAFDKGIDYDSYTLKKGWSKLKFVWDNWFEWEINGSAKDINALIDRYQLMTKHEQGSL